MPKRLRVLIGMAVGALWAIGVLWVGTVHVDLPIFMLVPSLAFAFLPVGLVLVLLIGRLAIRRFFDDAIIDGQSFATGSAAHIDQRVLVNTCEQTVLALCLWPPIGLLLGENGPGVVVALGVSLGLARLLFWAGYHISPLLRGFGFAASFYPTVAALLWVIVQIALPSGGA